VSSLRDVFRTLAEMRTAGVIADYAIGGATAVLFYAEPTRTFDVDVFVTLPGQASGTHMSLDPVYAWAIERGLTVQDEHVMIEGVPVQLLPAYNALLEQAVADARVHDYEGVPARVVGPEHLVALALDAGGARRRERAWQLLESAEVDRARIRGLLEEHGIPAVIPDDV
jgi:hypothetical protein